MDAVRSLDEDEAVRDGRCLDACDELLDRGEDVIGCSELLYPMRTAEVDRQWRGGVCLEVGVQLLMGFVARFAQLVHVAEDDGAGTIQWLDVEEVVQRRVHARGVGIVGICDDLVATGGGDELGAAVAGSVAGEGFVNALGSYVKVKGDGDRSECVGKVVVPDEVSLYAMLLDAKGGAGPGEVEEELIARAWGGLPDDTCLGIGAVVDTIDTFAHLLERLVFGTEEDDTLACAEAIIELALGAAYPFDGAEALEVRPTDVGDESVVGLGDGAELIDVPRLAGTHLDESKLMLWGEA